MRANIKDLIPDLWPDLEKLFGLNGACGGCWCMAWRLQKGERWEELKGEKAKQRFQQLVKTGKAHGILAFHNGDPIGWCSFDPRKDFYKLDRAPSFRCDDAEKVWSIPCFFIKKEFRNQGISGQLLNHALKAMRKLGATVAEGYPVRPGKFGKAVPAAFAWTGTPTIFKKAGFKVVGNKGGGKERVRRVIEAVPLQTARRR